MYWITHSIVIHSSRRSANATESLCDTYKDALKVASKNLHSFTSELVSSLKGRVETERSVNSILITAGNLFDVSKIVQYEKDDFCNIKDDFETYVKLAKESGNLDIEISVDDLVEEYDIFTSRIKEIAPQF